MSEPASKQQGTLAKPSPVNGSANGRTPQTNGTASLRLFREPQTPLLTHERAIHVFGALADFAARMPALTEVDHKMYRDLCRAAMCHLGDERKAEEMLLAHGVDAFLFRACRCDVGAFIVKRLREVGITVKLATGPLRMMLSPREKLTPEIQTRIKNWREAIVSALLAEVPEG